MLRLTAERLQRNPTGPPSFQSSQANRLLLFFAENPHFHIHSEHDVKLLAFLKVRAGSFCFFALPAKGVTPSSPLRPPSVPIIFSICSLCPVIPFLVNGSGCEFPLSPKIYRAAPHWPFLIPFFSNFNKSCDLSYGVSLTKAALF